MPYGSLYPTGTPEEELTAAAGTLPMPSYFGFIQRSLLAQRQAAQVPQAVAPEAPAPAADAASQQFGSPAPPSPFDIAAARTRQSVQPAGGRPEGATTKVLENYVPHVIGGLLNLPERATRAAGEFQRTGEYDPAPVLETAMHMVGSPRVPSGALGSSMKNPLYHGSPRTNLTHIDPSARGPLGPGVYTSPAEGIAKIYAGPEGKVYELPAKDRDIYQGAGHRTDEEWFGFKNDKERLLAAADPDKRAALGGILDKMWSGDGYPAYQRIMHLHGGDQGAQALFKKAGFEGISGLVDGPETMLFNQQPLAGNKPYFVSGNRGPR